MRPGDISFGMVSMAIIVAAVVVQRMYSGKIVTFVSYAGARDGNEHSARSRASDNKRVFQRKSKQSPVDGNI